jgi:hypothetical protein
MDITLYIDVITMAMAVGLLVLCFQKRTISFKTKLLISFSAFVYLYAQAGWAASFVAGNVWGAMFNNYLWFIFNFTAFSIMYLVLTGDDE